MPLKKGYCQTTRMSPSAKKTSQTYVLLDSCIIEYWLDKNIAPAMTRLTKNLFGDKIKIAISEVTFSELINGAYKDKERKVISLLESFTSFPLSKRVILGSGKLGSVYKEFNKDLHKAADIADRMIASTSIVYNIPIMTSNIRHFPHPFFTSIRSDNITYKTSEKSCERIICFEIIKPNYPVINNKFNLRK